MDENAVSTPSVETSAPDTSSNYESPSTETTDVGESSDSSSTESSVVATADTEDGGMSVVKDPVTGKVSLKFGDKEDSDSNGEGEDGDSDNEPYGDGNKATDAVNMGQNNVRDLPKYNLDEFSNALVNNNVDPNRVPQEYQAQYADYKIKEALQQRQAQQQAAFEREQAQRRQIEQQMNPENRARVNRDFYNALEDEAYQAALKDLGITQDKLDEAEFEDDGEQLKEAFNNAKDFHKQRIKSELEERYRQEQNYKVQQQQRYAEIENFITQQRASEPNFEAIDKMLATRYQTMPLNQGKVIEQALTALQNGTIDDNGMQIIGQYWNYCRKEFYAQRSGLQGNGSPQRSSRKAPPVVESAGQGQQVNKSYKPDYKSLRGASVSERNAWFKEYFKNNGW